MSPLLRRWYNLLSAVDRFVKANPGFNRLGLVRRSSLSSHVRSDTRPSSLVLPEDLNIYMGLKSYTEMALLFLPPHAFHSPLYLLSEMRKSSRMYQTWNFLHSTSPISWSLKRYCLVTTLLRTLTLVHCQATPVVCDFGLSTVIGDITETTASATLTTQGSARYTEVTSVYRSHIYIVSDGLLQVSLV